MDQQLPLNLDDGSSRLRSDPPLDEGERQALRNYLQRGETRISTIHSIAGAFIGGAVLLALLPTFVRDTVQVIVRTGFGLDALWLQGCLFASLGIVGLVPLYALFMLIEDLIDFYFSQDIPNTGISSRNFIPRFSISGMSVASDELSPRVALLIALEQRKSDFVNYVLPDYLPDLDYLERLRADSGMHIIPKSRRMIAEFFLDQGMVLREKQLQETNAPVRVGDYRDLMTAFGLAGTVDRTLLQEAAATETAMVRSSLLVRRLVLRYAKAFLVSTATSVLIIVLGSYLTYILENPDHNSLAHIRYDTTFALLIAIIAWCAIAPLAVQIPIRWIYTQTTSRSSPRLRDPHLLKFERTVSLLVFVVIAVAALAAALWWQDTAWQLYRQSIKLAVAVIGIAFVAGLNAYLWFHPAFLKSGWSAPLIAPRDRRFNPKAGGFMDDQM